MEPRVEDRAEKATGGYGMGKLNGKVAVISGGSSGIGRAAVKLFASEGAAVAFGALEEGASRDLAQEVRQAGGDVLDSVTDVTSPASVERLIEAAEDRWGRVDVVYANAGLLETGTAPETSTEMWQVVVAVNLSGQFHLAKYGVPALERSGGGSIIFTASELGLVGASGCVAYCAAKGGVISMTRAIAIDSAASGIRVNCLCPGPVQTPLLERFFTTAEEPDEVRRRQTEPVLLKRFAEPEEIAKAALYLASEDSSYMTGATLVVDGGVTAWYGL